MRAVFNEDAEESEDKDVVTYIRLPPRETYEPSAQDQRAFLPRKIPKEYFTSVSARGAAGSEILTRTSLAVPAAARLRRLLRQSSVKHHAW